MSEDLHGARPSLTTRRLLWTTSVVTCAVLIIGGTTLYQTIGARATSEQIRSASYITACRSELRAEVDLATTEVQDVVLRGLVEVAEDDHAGLQVVLEDADRVLAAARRTAAKYADGVALSRTDPEAFVAACER